MIKQAASKAYKTTVKTTAVMVGVTALAGCQLLTGYQTIDTPEQPTPSAGKIQQQPGNTTVTCEGMYHCEIGKVDQKQLIDSETHMPVAGVKVMAKDQPVDLGEGDLALVPLLTTKLNGLTNYYVRLKPGHHEIHINFYPEKNDKYIERFALIHDFSKVGDYRLQAYRAPMSHQADSLLDSASPSPLCVELLLDGEPMRRFCKLPVDSRQNEFIEVTDVPKGVETWALLSSDKSVFVE